MARVTVEDCLLFVPDRFELVILASERTRNVNSGASITVPREGDKNSVISLREIAEGRISPDSLRDSLIRGFQRYLEAEEVSSDLKELLDEEEKKWIQGASEEQSMGDAFGFSEREDLGADSDDSLDTEELY